MDATGEFVFRPGPIFTQLLLADEVNRTPPKTQAALLESMQEHQVTVEGTTFQLPEPFVVLATANPIEHEGTYPLPEAQLDRFMLRVSLGYPGGRRRVGGARPSAAPPARRPGPRTGRPMPPTFVAMQRAVESVAIEESVGRYCVLLVRATREHRAVMVGASPRGALALMQAARARRCCAGATSWCRRT